MLQLLKEKSKALAKNKKGISQFVEMLIILGVTITVGVVVVTVVLNAVNKQKKKTEGADGTDANDPADPTYVVNG